MAQAALVAGGAGALGSAVVAELRGRGWDVTVLDLGQEHVIDPPRFQSKARNTPFGGWACVGGPWLTVVGGRVVMREGALVDGGEP